MEKLTPSLEDYLEVIYNYSSLEEKVRAVDISRKLDISRASVTEALKKLAAKGFITYGRYDSIALTDIGESFAKEIASKHKTLQLFFEKVLNLSEEESSINACRIEHVITENAFQKISEYIAK